MRKAKSDLWETKTLKGFREKEATVKEIDK